LDQIDESPKYHFNELYHQDSDSLLLLNTGVYSFISAEEDRESLSNSTIIIENCNFIKHKEMGKGGLIFFGTPSHVFIINSRFEGSQVEKGTIQFLNSANLLRLENMVFNNNLNEISSFIRYYRTETYT
jgi:hypothetical protein